VTWIGESLGPWTYLVMLFGWAIPVWVVQFAYGWRVILAHWRTYVGATTVATAYLSLTDALALGQGIWEISPARSIGLFVGNVPIEEILFFACTNSFVVGLAILGTQAPLPRFLRRTPAQPSREARSASR
jgi:lycopene cyclase domain-containing protein